MRFGRGTGRGGAERNDDGEGGGAQDLAGGGDQRGSGGGLREAVDVKPDGRDPNEPQRPGHYRVQSRRESPHPQERRAPALRTALAACAASSSSRSPRPRSPTAAPAETGGAGQVEPGGNVSNTAFDRQGMWVWYVSHSEGGSVGAIIARAKANDVGTVYVKAGDGGGPWSQFSTGLVQALHRGGLDVCAWQFVYGDAPVAEAKAAAAAVKKGRRLLRDRRRGRLRGQVRRRRPLRPRPARPHRRHLPGRPRRLPLRRLPPVVPLLGLLRPGRRHLQPAADVLEDDRHLGPRRSTSTPTSTTASTATRSTRSARPTKPPAAPRSASSAASPPATAGCRRAGGPGRRPTARSGGRLGADSALQPVTGYRLEVVHPLLKRSSKRRHGRLGAGAPDRRRAPTCR